MKQKHEKNDTPTGQQAESGHQESESATLGAEPLSPYLIEPKNFDMSTEPTPSELNVEMEQLARLLNLDLRAETRNGVSRCVKGTESLSAVERNDGTLGLPARMASLLFPSDETFMGHMLTILFAEALEGRHTQQSLDEALDLCEELTPSSRGWVEARALHRFLEEERDFPWWCQYIARLIEVHSPKGCRHTSLQAALKDYSLTGTRPSRPPFRVNANLAFKMALSSPTRRGSLLRDEYMIPDRVAYLPNKIDFMTALERWSPPWMDESIFGPWDFHSAE